jgi:hypothetical protein
MAGSREQSDLKFIFECFGLRGDSGLADMRCLTCACELSEFRNRGERSQLINFHEYNLLFCGAAIIIVRRTNGLRKK